MGLVATSFVLFFTVLSGCSNDVETPKIPPPDVLVTTVDQEDIPIYGEYVGETESPRTVELRARVEGFLITINFKEGSLVKKGELLFLIDPRQYEADYQKAKAQLARDEASLQKARQNLARYRSLHGKDAVSTNQLENAITHEREMVATRAADLQAVEQAKLNLSFTRIYAPLTGRIGRAEVRIGALVGKGEPTLLATISQVDPIYVNGSISERDYLLAMKRREESLKKQREGIPVRKEHLKVTMILADDSMYPFEGFLNFIDRTVDRNTSTLPFRLEFPNPSGILRPGQFARIRVVLEDRKDALLIPQRAVQESMEGQIVFVVNENNHVERRRVEAGPRHGSRWVIEEGLLPGERVVVEGLQRVRPGIQVNPSPLPGMMETEKGTSSSTTPASPVSKQDHKS
jgi:membrane fusion protein (multidrug efflux system)